MKITAPVIYFKSLTIKNVRSFGGEHFFDFSKDEETPNLWNVIIGDNGIGKTTILKSLVFGLTSSKNDPFWNKHINLKGFERYNCEEQSFNFISFIFDDFIYKGEIDFSIDLNKGLKIKSIDNIFIETVFFAYGASRRIGTKGISVENDFSAISLFDDTSGLINIEEWLIQSEYKALKNKKFDTHNKVVETIKQLLQGEIHDIKIDTETGSAPKVLFKTDFGWVKMHELSLGYKTLLAWVVDFAKGMIEKYPESDTPLAEPAVCMVDEIDLHIHPGLQKKLIKFLSDTFPKTQFIVTAHSPLILQALPDANVILLTKEGDSVKVHQNILDIRNWRVDQILMSDLFGVSSIRSEGSEQKLARRKELILKDERNTAEEEELKELNLFAEELPVGDTQQEIQGFDLLKKFAKELSNLQNQPAE